jgi:hypothetical protein
MRQWGLNTSSASVTVATRFGTLHRSSLLSLLQRLLTLLIGRHGFYPLLYSLPRFIFHFPNSTNHQQLSHRCKLNLVMSPHRARCLDLTGRLSESASMQPVPVPVPVPVSLPVMDLVHTVRTNILKMCRASLEANRGGDDFTSDRGESRRNLTRCLSTTGQRWFLPGISWMP